MIFFNRFLDFRKAGDSFSVSLFSRDIGVISHYLSDYMCLAHAMDWTMPKNTVKHLRYESDLAEMAKDHNFDDRIIKVSQIEPETRLRANLGSVKAYIEEVLEEYMSTDHIMENDLDYALSLNITILEHMIESILEYEEEYIFEPEKKILV